MVISRLPASLLLTGLLTACSWHASPQYTYTTPDANDTAVDKAVVKALGCEPTGMADAPTYAGATEQEAAAAYKAANEGTRLVLFANRGDRPKLYSESRKSAAYVDENATKIRRDARQRSTRQTCPGGGATGLRRLNGGRRASMRAAPSRRRSTRSSGRLRAVGCATGSWRTLPCWRWEGCAICCSLEPPAASS